MSNESREPRVVIIGLDGATFNIIKPLIKKNELPFFQKLMHNGSYGVLESNLPLNSAANWTSLFTGKNPGKHNIYDFLAYDHSSYQSQLITSQTLKSPFLWNIANYHNFKTILLNVPITSEPEPLNGIMVSGMLTPSDQKCAYPEAIADELQQQDYIIDSAFARKFSSEQYFNQIMKTLIKQEKTFQNLIAKYPWDLAIITLNALGKAQHDFWNEPDKLEALYIQVDSFLNKISESLTENTYFMVVSHHGFKPVSKKFFVNEWLWEVGLLHKKITIHQTRLTDVYDIIFNHSNHNSNNFVTNFLAKTGVTKDNIRSVIPVFICEYFKHLIPWRIKKYFPKEYLDVLWNRTHAYFVSTNVHGININLKGREPQGIVEPGIQFEQLRDRIIGELYRLKDPYTLENVIDEIYRKEDFFQGPCLESAPDIIFVPHQYDYFLDGGKRTCRLSIGSANDDYPIYAFHDPKGVFFITGPNVKAGEKINDIDIFDVAPTVLHLLGIIATEDFDGQILHRVFENQMNYDSVNRHHFIAYEDTLPSMVDEFFEQQITRRAFST